MGDLRKPSEDSERIFPRATRNITAWLDQNGSFVRCIAVDFGVQGACLELENPFPDGPEVKLSFELDPNWTVHTLAKKVWERQDQGKYFVGITYRTERSADKSLIGPWIHRMRRSDAGS